MAINKTIKKSQPAPKPTISLAPDTITIRAHIAIGPNREYAILGYSEEGTNTPASKEDMRRNLKDWYVEFDPHDIFEIEITLPVSTDNSPRYKFSVT